MFSSCCHHWARLETPDPCVMEFGQVDMSDMVKMGNAQVCVTVKPDYHRHHRHHPHSSSPATCQHHNYFWPYLGIEKWFRCSYTPGGMGAPFA